MKKILLLLTVIMLIGCSNQPQESKNKIYKDGHYEAVVKGYGGNFTMKATFKNDKLTDITVMENEETPSIGGVAIEQLITQMKEKQNENIDTVSGATKTSQAMIDAYKDILSRAKLK